MNASGNVSPFNLSPLRLDIVFQFAFPQSFILFFKQPSGVEHGVLPLGENPENSSLRIQDLNALPQCFANTLCFALEAEVRS
jgi:hypothetical protein